MRPAVVIDAGNTMMKWGRVSRAGEIAAVARVLPSAVEWSKQILDWDLGAKTLWVVAGSAPKVVKEFATWARSQGHFVDLVDSYERVPLQIELPQPAAVGIDRLLNAVGVGNAVPPGQGALLVDAGSAITIDWLDEDKLFRGGAILPGFRLMSRALNDYTEKLPFVELRLPLPTFPGRDTVEAISCGMVAAAAGSVTTVAREIRQPFTIYLTGGDGPLLLEPIAAALRELNPPVAVVDWPTLTLEGLLRTHEALP